MNSSDNIIHSGKPKSIQKKQKKVLNGASAIDYMQSMNEVHLENMFGIMNYE
jgi:hypothetical protein